MAVGPGALETLSGPVLDLALGLLAQLSDLVEDEEEDMDERLKATVKTSLGLQRELYYDAVHRARLLGFTTREYIEVLLREDLRKPIERSVAAIPGEEEVKV